MYTSTFSHSHVLDLIILTQYYIAVLLHDMANSILNAEICTISIKVNTTTSHSDSYWCGAKLLILKLF